MPVLARVYGIPPKDQGALTLWEYRALKGDYERQRQAEEVT